MSRCFHTFYCVFRYGFSPGVSLASVGVHASPPNCGMIACKFALPKLLDTPAVLSVVIQYPPIFTIYPNPTIPSFMQSKRCHLLQGRACFPSRLFDCAACNDDACFLTLSSSHVIDAVHELSRRRKGEDQTFVVDVAS